MTSSKRISVQLCRVAAAMQVLHDRGEASISDVYLSIAELMPTKPCRRTVQRDLEALAAVGIVQARQVKTWLRDADGRTLRQLAFVYSMASPEALKERLKMVAKMTPREKQLAVRGVEVEAMKP